MAKLQRWHVHVKYIRVQVEGHTVVEFVNGSRLCSCGLIRGPLPSLVYDPVCTAATEAVEQVIGR